MNPLMKLFPGGLSLSTIIGVSVAVLGAVYQVTGNPVYSAIAAGLSHIVLPEESKK